MTYPNLSYFCVFSSSYFLSEAFFTFRYVSYVLLTLTDNLSRHLGMLEVPYRFQTWYDNSCKVQEEVRQQPFPESYLFKHFDSQDDKIVFIFMLDFGTKINVAFEFHYHAMLELPENDRAIKGLAFCLQYGQDPCTMGGVFGPAQMRGSGPLLWSGQLSSSSTATKPIETCIYNTMQCHLT